MELVNIQGQKWHKINLGVSNFRNGDTIYIKVVLNNLLNFKGNP